MSIQRHIFTCCILTAGIAVSAASPCLQCDGCSPRIALTTNLVHDAAALPDLGLELSLARRFSLKIESTYGWWGRTESNHVWRLGSTVGEMRWWPTAEARRRALSGHHVGVWGGAVKYDFQLGGDGRQSVEWTAVTGLSYGHSWRLNNRLNLDVTLRIGYIGGTTKCYKPSGNGRCVYDIKKIRYWGPVDAGITLVWFPFVHNKPQY